MKPKILYLMHMPPPIHGAALVGKQIKNSTIINKAFEGHYINTSLAKNISDIGGLGLKKIILYFDILKQTRKILKREKFDICYITPNATGSAFLKDFILVMLVKSFHVRTLFHFHNKGFSKNQENIFYNYLYRLFFKNTQIILLAENLYYDIEKYVSKRNIFYSYVGISPKISKEHKEKNNEKIQFIFLSNLIIEKGIIIALKACNILKQKGYNFSFIFAGGESFEMNKNQFNAMINSYNLQDRIKYLGRVSEERKNTLLSKSDVFVFPTYYHNECFPAVILEAMKNSLAVISTYEGAIPIEVIEGETGFLCKQKDVMDLVANMEKFINEPYLANILGSRGKEIFYERYTNNIFEEKMCNIFNKVLQKTINTDIQTI
ncbi:MAG: glycosyltransferase [Mangrovibacterium sp.]